jgi:hypothetical protein
MELFTRNPVPARQSFQHRVFAGNPLFTALKLARRSMASAQCGDFQPHTYI